MHGYEVHEAFHQNSEIQSLWVRGFSPREKRTLQNSENVLDLKMYIIYILEKNCMHGYFVHKVFYFNCN